MSEETLELAQAVFTARAERDMLYTYSVNPRRNARRALEALKRGDTKGAAEYMAEVSEGLEALTACWKNYDERHKDISPEVVWPSP